MIIYKVYTIILLLAWRFEVWLQCYRVDGGQLSGSYKYCMYLVVRTHRAREEEKAPVGARVLCMRSNLQFKVGASKMLLVDDVSSYSAEIRVNNMNGIVSTF